MTANSQICMWFESLKEKEEKGKAKKIFEKKMVFFQRWWKL